MVGRFQRRVKHSLREHGFDKAGKTLLLSRDAAGQRRKNGSGRERERADVIVCIFEPFSIPLYSPFEIALLC